MFKKCLDCGNTVEAFFLRKQLLLHKTMIIKKQFYLCSDFGNLIV